MTHEEKGAIKHELAAMHEADQAMRNVWLQGGEWDFDVDTRHTARLKELLALMDGWPRLSEWGVPAVQDVWLLVQHADHDPAFQRACLEVLAALPDDERQRFHLAYLTDRVAMNEGRPQVFGSQLRKNAAGDYEAYTLEAPETVDDRRSWAGLESLEDYIEGSREQWKNRQ